MSARGWLCKATTTFLDKQRFCSNICFNRILSLKSNWFIYKQWLLTFTILHSHLRLLFWYIDLCLYIHLISNSYCFHIHSFFTVMLIKSAFILNIWLLSHSVNVKLCACALLTAEKCETRYKYADLVPSLCSFCVSVCSLDYFIIHPHIFIRLATNMTSSPHLLNEPFHSSCRNTSY